MNRLLLFEATLFVGLSLFATGCERKATAQGNLAVGTGPVPTTVQPDMDANNFRVEHPEQFPLATAGEHVAGPALFEQSDTTIWVEPGMAAEVDAHGNLVIRPA